MKKENRISKEIGATGQSKTPFDHSRRDALKKLGLTAAAVAGPLIVPSRLVAQKTAKSTTPPPSERINVGLIGVGGAMNETMRKLLTRDDVFIKATCDVDERRYKAALVDIKRAYWKFKAEFGDGLGTQDHREIIANDDIDAVVIATPVHWHAAIALDAIRAGKDVLIQSPMTLTVREGQLVEEAARNHGAIAQCIAPMRCKDDVVKACGLVRNGYLGQIKEVYVARSPFPESNSLPAQEPPKELDYDRWLGPAPVVPYHSSRVNGSRVGGWRSFWDYGVRTHGEPGFDRYDVIQWALGMENTGPIEFTPAGVDDQEYATYRYANGTTVKIGHPVSTSNEIEFVGAEASISIADRGSLNTEPRELSRTNLTVGDTRLPLEHVVEDSWIENIKARTKPIVDASVAHRTTSICLLNAIAERTERKLTWDPEKQEITDNPGASRMLDRPRRAPYTLV
ncbi:MAG: putative dehydrogenase [Pseudoalteromonas tetraodonis]|jgi:predicted dehydrogenase